FMYHVRACMQRSMESMRERTKKLKVEVLKMFDAGMTVADTVMLVDTIERLGVDHHFREEIAEALTCIQNEEIEFGVDNNLHITALRFRLLRQHGFWVSTDVFNKFKDDMGSFSATLSTDPTGLLNLYNAAHMATPGEHALDEAISFSRHHLESMKVNLCSPMRDQVSRALDIPLPRLPKLLETRHYITEYEKEEAHNDLLLELARLDFNLVRSLHLKELRTLSLWWRDLYDTVKLSYARDRLVESYFWTCAMLHEEEYSHARILFAKTFGIFSLMDDTYDVYATLEECIKLHEAIERFRMQIKLLSKSYLQEAKWSNEKYVPSSEEHLEASIVSSAVQPLSLVTLTGIGEVAIKNAYDWAIAYPDAMKAGAAISRFLNDIASYKLGKHKNDVASFVECHMKEHSVMGNEAVTAVIALVEHMWRKMNQACMEIDPRLLPLMQLVVKLARTTEVMYLGGRDAYTFGKDLKDPIISLFLEPIQV
ncbi:hypothetical protein EJB05_27811, partial [Eragrostis curvula]